MPKRSSVIKYVTLNTVWERVPQGSPLCGQCYQILMTAARMSKPCREPASHIATMNQSDGGSTPSSSTTPHARSLMQPRCETLHRHPPTIGFNTTEIAPPTSPKPCGVRAQHASTNGPNTANLQAALPPALRAAQRRYDKSQSIHPHRHHVDTNAHGTPSPAVACTHCWPHARPPDVNTSSADYLPTNPV